MARVALPLAEEDLLSPALALRGARGVEASEDIQPPGKRWKRGDGAATPE
jgi:hypothetical protein